MIRGDLRLLLVEDDVLDEELTRRHLQDASPATFEITIARSLAQALVHLRTGVFDAIILDLTLPDSTGIDTLREIRRAGVTIPVIVLSGALDDGHRRQAEEHGAAALIDKHAPAERIFGLTILHAVARHRAEEQQRQVLTLIETHPDALLVVSQAGVVRYVNKAAMDLFGRAREDFVGELLGFSVSEGSTTEVRILRRDEERIEERVGEIRVVPMVWQGEPATLASIRDVTLRKQAEDLRARGAELEVRTRRFEDADRLKNEFLANMSHELRTPLNAIIGFAEILVDELVEPGSPEQKAFQKDILTSGRHLLRLISDLLDLSKIEAGKLDFRPEVVSLKAILVETLAILRPLLEEKHIETELDCSPEDLEVDIDPARLRQILYNYLSNAVKFTPAGGRVIARMRVEDIDSFRIEIEDNGVGIALSDRERLFQKFEQLHAGTGKRHQGTGLGLALTRSLVEAQGGSVDVRSTPGKGSVFVAVLPRRLPDSLRAPVSSRPAA